MRKLAWFAAGFAASAALFAYLLSGTVLLVLALVSGLLGGVCLFLKRCNAAVASVVLFGFAVGMVYSWGYDALVLRDLKKYDGKTVYATVEVTDFASDTGYGLCVDGIARWDHEKVQMRVFYSGPSDVKPGDLLKGTLRIRYTPEGGQKESTYHKGESIFLLGYCETEMTHYPQNAQQGKYFAIYLRKAICERIDALFSEKTAFFAKALLIGDDSDIPFADNIAFQRSGIRHVVAVSGLHVSILMSLLYFCTRRKKYLTLFCSIPLLFVFAAVAGFTPSIIRACVTHLLVVLAIAIEKEYDFITAICFSVMGMLLYNPLTVSSASFQLSICCMLGMFLFSSPIQKYLLDKKRLGRWKNDSLMARLARWFSGSVSVSLSTMILTMPLCAIYFGSISIVGVITNLLCLWVITFIFCGIVAACILSVIWLPLGSILAAVIAVPIQLVLLLCRLLAQIPFGSAYTASPYALAWIGAVYFLLALHLYSKKKRPVLLSAGILALYALSLVMGYVEPYLDQVRMTVIDVGQGQCILLQSKSDAYLIDCGAEDGEYTAMQVMNQIYAQGVYALDGLILTHYDSDHANGAAYLLDVMPVKQLYLPDTESDSAIRQELSLQDVPVRWICDKTSFSCGTGKITLFPADLAITGNESSMCILFQGERCDILITGDRDIQGELALLEQGIGDIDVLVAGHHGAETSTGLGLLQSTQPEIVVISAGKNNFHGHPSWQTLLRLERFGCVIRRTDLEGTIIIRG